MTTTTRSSLLAACAAARIPLNHGRRQQRFLAFFAAEIVRHFREEELLFPQSLTATRHRTWSSKRCWNTSAFMPSPPSSQRSWPAGKADPAVIRALGQQLEARIRVEERRLFPLIEQLLTDETLAALASARDRVETRHSERSGPIWGTASEELNATLLSWNAGQGPPEHVNDERDVLVVVLAGSVTARTGEDAHELGAGEATIIGKGQRREITAGGDGARYLSVHRRRPPLQIRSAPRAIGRV